MRPRRRLLLLAVVVCLIILVGYLTAQRPKSVRGWGMLIDLDNDCTVSPGEGKLTITVPGGTHDLNKQLGGMSAPRVLREVDGDFTIQVKVSGEFDPGDEAAKHNNRDIAPFCSAGLLLWQDEKNYLRLERNGWCRDGKIGCYKPLIEYYRDSVPPPESEATLEQFFKGQSTWLKFERRGNSVTASYSHDGEEWTTAKEITVELPPRIQAGIAAVNTSTKRFSVEFEQLQITNP
jgi:regulation of enolase protein 1 (concanavalin A-like superfamily)